MNLEKSLQAIKTDLANKEATLKTIQQNHPHLADITEEQILIYFQVTSIYELDKYIKQLKESTLHHDDNLSTQESNICSCTDSNGEPKNIYHSEASAQEEADTLSRQKKFQLSLYLCPYGCGWHLTKR